MFRGKQIAQQAVNRQKLGKKWKASVRAAETSEQTVHRLEQSRKHKASVRAAETSELYIMIIAFQTENVSIYPI